jgi:hypothetical protein
MMDYACERYIFDPSGVQNNIQVKIVQGIEKSIHRKLILARVPFIRHYCTFVGETFYVTHLIVHSNSIVSGLRIR